MRFHGGGDIGGQAFGQAPTEGDMTRSSEEIYYDPYDFQIDDDPYPIWKRMRDELPLYRNDRYDFFAVSRFADIETCSRDCQP